jgi:hypothetical protein
MSERLYFEVKDDESAGGVSAVLGALGFDAERVGELGERLEYETRVLADRLLPGFERAIFHAMLVTDTTRDAARLVGISRGTAKYFEFVVRRKLGVSGRLELLRRIAGVKPEEAAAG